MKKRAVVICPGRGTYTKETLGYLRGAAPKNENEGLWQNFLADIDDRRRQLDEPTISALDSAEIFKPQVHTKGEHASSLIYACAYADFLSINREKYDVVAVTGNSMGWYLTCAFGGSLGWAEAFDVVNTMGSMMKEEIIGGQVIYPVIDSDWRHSADAEKHVFDVVASINSRPGLEVHLSIRLGGYLVLGGNRGGLNALLKELKPIENYPFQLINHAAFHTPLLNETSSKAFQMLPLGLFRAPDTPLVDGRGHIWQPYSTAVDELYEYTLGHQVVAPYDYSRAVSTALKEFAPDCLILLGPGSSLGGATGQILIENDWFEMKSKADFTRRQEQSPFVLAMGRPEQRGLVVG